MLGLQAAAKCGKVNMWEETNGVGFVCRCLWYHFSADKSLESSPVKGEFISCL